MTSPPPKRRRRYWVSLGALALVAILCTGCQLSYLLHLAHGQLKVITGKVPIDEVLADSTLAAGPRASLELIKDVKKFAADSLGYSPEGAYNDFYDTGGKPASYVLSASARDRFEPYTWWFPIVGTVPYKGFFDREMLEKERQVLAVDYDVHVGQAAAYSTLGWFEDPVLSGWLDDPPGELAELVLHELTHREVYLASSARFNETLATYFGEAAAERYLRHKFGPESQELREYLGSQRDAQRFTALMRTVKKRLDDFYARATPEALETGRQEIFDAARKMVADEPFEVLDYSWFQKANLNNASVLALDRYYGDLPIFQALGEAMGRDLVAVLALLKALEGDVENAVFEAVFRQCDAGEVEAVARILSRAAFPRERLAPMLEPPWSESARALARRCLELREGAVGKP